MVAEFRRAIVGLYQIMAGRKASFNKLNNFKFYNCVNKFRSIELSLCQNYVDTLYKDAIGKVRNHIGNNLIWFGTDKMTIKQL